MMSKTGLGALAAFLVLSTLGGAQSLENRPSSPQLSQDYPSPNLTNPAYTGNPFATSPNNYVGQCTWYVYGRIQETGLITASQLSSLGIFRRDANTWYSDAVAAGFATGSTPRPGAIAYWNANHVAFVENSSGQFTQSNMTPTPGYDVVIAGVIGYPYVKLRSSRDVSTNTNVIWEIPRFTVMSVLSGPVAGTGNSYQWFQLTGHGYTGWAAWLDVDTGGAAHSGRYYWNFTRIQRSPGASWLGNPTGYIYLTSPPVLTVNSPNGGETWQTGSSYTVSWSISGDTSAINGQAVALSIDGGTNYSLISPALSASTRSFNFTPNSGHASNSAMILVWAYDSVSNFLAFDTSNGTFTVENPGYTLSVNSTGASGVGISSSTGHGGTTNYSLSVSSGTNVNLTAPATAGGKTFTGWTGDVTSANQTISFSMTANKTVTANYATPSYTLSVNSSGASGVGISSGTGHGGTTNYSLSVSSGTNVNLTAPATAGGKTFTGWTGDVTSANQTISFSMTGNRTVTASYGTPVCNVTTPNTPSGPSNGQTGQSLEYTTSGSSCSQGHSVQYRFSWGDLSYSSWGSASQSKTYGSPGVFTIQAQARCASSYAESVWSGGKQVAISPPANNLPNTPTLISPGVEGICGLTPTLQASSFSDPDGDSHANSQWQVDDNDGFLSPEWDSGEGYAASTQAPVPPGRLSCATTYFWRVRYKDSRGAWSSWPNRLSFTTGNPPLVATSLAQNVTAASADIYAFVANTSGLEVEELRFDWGTTPALGQVVGDANILRNGHVFWAMLSELQPDTPYYFQASARTGAGWGHGAVQSFTTQTPAQPVLSVTPSDCPVGSGAGSISFSVSNTGTGTMNWTASVIPGGSWLTITSGGSGTDSGTINCSFTANSNTSSRTGTIQVTASGATGSPANVTVTQAGQSSQGTLSDALDNAQLAWSTSGNANWFFQTQTTHDGVDAARSGVIGHSQQSVLSTTVNGPTRLNYWMKVSSQSNWDWLTVAVDGAEWEKWSGEVGWRLRSCAVPLGSHTISWTYSKDGSVVSGSDAAWLDQVSQYASTAELLISGFYWSLLDREPEPGAVGAWQTGYLDYMLDREVDVRFIAREMARSFLNSQEYANRNRSNADFIRDCYRAFLYRSPGSAELNGWLAGQWNRMQAMTVFGDAAEFSNLVETLYPNRRGNPTRNFVTWMYIGVLDRLADVGGLLYWAAAMDGASDKRAAAKSMARMLFASPEFLGKMPTNQDRVIRMYRAFLARYPGDHEIAYWKAELDSGRWTLDRMIDCFGDSLEFAQRILHVYFPGWRDPKYPTAAPARPDSEDILPMPLPNGTGQEGPAAVGNWEIYD